MRNGDKRSIAWKKSRLAKDEVMTRFTAVVLLCVLLGLGCATSVFAAAKKTPPAGKSQPALNPNEKPADPPLNLPGKLQDAVAGAAKSNNDYVPCFFDRNELLALRPKPEASTLSSYDAEQLRNNVIHEALDPANASTFEDDQAKQFATDIGDTVFEGLTQSQALSKVLSILKKYERLPRVTKAEEQALQSATQSKESFFGLTINDARAKVKGTGSEHNKIDAGDVELDKVESAPNPAKDKVVGAAQATLTAVQRPLDIFCSTTILSYETMRKAFGETMADEYIGVQVVVRNLNPNQEFLVQSALFKVDSDINGRIGKYFTGVDKMTAREYMLASRELGKRNLAVHIAQGVGGILSSVATFTGPGVKQASGAVNGGLISALTTVFPDHNTEQLKLIDDEGFSNSRTDRTVVPKSGTAEFVIFVSSKEFGQGWWTQECAQNEVIRITKPSKDRAKSEEKVSLENGTTNDQTQPGTDKKAKSQAPPAAEMANCLGNFNSVAPDPKCVNAEIGIDLETARNVCYKELKRIGKQTGEAGKSGADTQATNQGDANKEPDDEQLFYYKPDFRTYQRWSARSLALFRELSLAVVAGTHVNEPTDTTPSLTKTDCPVDDKGDLKIDPAKPTLSCTLTGTNLDKVSQLKLRNAQDKTDQSTANGNVTTTTSGDSKSTTVAFQTSDLQKLTAKAYKVSIVTSAGAETETDQILHLNNGPTLTEVSPSTINQADLSKKTVTFTGTLLDKLKNVCLATGAATAGQTVSVAEASEAPATKKTLDFSKVKKPMANGTYNIYLDACENAPQTPSSQKLTIVAPVISDFTPTSGKVADPITINGTNLKDATGVSFGGKAAKPTNSSDGQMKVTVPAGAQTGKLTVTTPAGLVTSETEFKVNSTKTASH
jgi:hypothetical protein